MPDARRASLAKRNPRSKTLSVRMTPKEYESVESYSKARGMTKAEYVLWAIEAAEGKNTTTPRHNLPEQTGTSTGYRLHVRGRDA